MRRGDIIVNPWVSVDYCGELNPMYATIYLGNNFSLDYKGRKHSWADKVYKENAEHRCPWKVIGHIDLDEIIETAIRKAVKTENSSENPNNCETCRFDDRYGDESICKECARHYSDNYAPIEDEPQTESQYDFGEYADRLWKIAYERGKREALEQTEPSCDTCKLKGTTEWCKRQEVCRAYKPKDEPQTDYTPDCPFCKRYGTEDCLGYDCRHYKTYKTEPQTERSE